MQKREEGCRRPSRHGHESARQIEMRRPTPGDRHAFSRGNKRAGSTPTTRSRPSDDASTDNIGVDLGDSRSTFCVIDHAGQVIERRTAPTMRVPEILAAVAADRPKLAATPWLTERA